MTLWIILRLCEPIFGTGKDVLLDSGFFVEKGIGALEERGVDTGVITKKRKYWPKSVPGDEIERNFHYRYVGDADVLEAMIEEVPEGKPSIIFCFK